MLLLLTSYVNKIFISLPELCPEIQAYCAVVQRNPVFRFRLCRLQPASRNVLKSSGPCTNVERRGNSLAAIRVAALVVLALLRLRSRLPLGQA